MTEILQKLKSCKNIILTEEVAEHILNCDTKIAEKIIRDILLLSEYGLKLGVNYIHRISVSRYKLWELRTVFGKTHNRTLFFVVMKGKFLLTNAFIKKTRKVPKNEINKAESVYKEFLHTIKSRGD